MSNQFGGICPDCATDSDRGAVDTENLLGGTLGGFRMTRVGVENVSTEDVDGEGPFVGVRPNAGGGGTAEDGEVLSVIGESDVLRIDPTTDSVCGEAKVGGERGTGVRGGEGRKLGGEMVDDRAGLMNGLGHPYWPLIGTGLHGGRDGSDTVGVYWNG